MTTSFARAEEPGIANLMALAFGGGGLVDPLHYFSPLSLLFYEPQEDDGMMRRSQRAAIH